MVDKKRALRDLCDLNYTFGLFSGRWEEEANMNMASEEYLATMTLFAEEYDIEYDKDLSNYIEDEEYEAECYTMMYMADSIYEKVKEKLLTILGIYDSDEIQIIDVKEFGEEIAQKLASLHGDDLNIDHIYKDITYSLHDGIKADIAEFAFKYLDDNNIPYDD